MDTKLIHVVMLVVLTSFDSAVGIRCYECDTYTSPRNYKDGLCQNFFSNSGVNYDAFLMECEDDETVCRKVTYPPVLDKEDELYVRRGCGRPTRGAHKDDGVRDVEIWDGNEIITQVYECDEDGCNSAVHMYSMSNLMSVLVLALLLQ